MGHRTSLIRSSPKDAEDIFEGNNVLPFFWLMLIKEDDLRLKVSEMKKAYAIWEDDEAYEKYQDDNPDSTNIKVSRDDAIRNAQSAAPFIKGSFPKAAALFSDFISYLDKLLNPEDSIELNIISLANFADIDLLIANVSQDLRAIQEHDSEKVSGYFNGDFRYSLVGYDEFLIDKFKDYSPAYKQAIDKQEQQYQQQVKKKAELNKAELKSRRLKAIGLLLIGLLFLGGSVIIFLKEGLKSSFFYSIILAVAAIWISIDKLKSTTRYIK